jgi:hydroxymethylglutaryl-CoA lyase
MTTVEIIEVSPRDGLQNQATILSTQQKLELIGRLVETGSRRIEVTSFVNPARVPQMSDAEAVLAGLNIPNGVVTIGLVLNEAGLRRALKTSIHEIGVVAVASDEFGLRNQKQTSLQSVDMAKQVIASAKRAGRRAQVTIAVAFGCPFRGEVAVGHVASMAEAIADAGPHEIALADTIGVAVPSQVEKLVSAVRAAVPGIPLRCHFHNTRNTGIANAWAAVESGVARLDASAGGIGGCPFAPRASGNIATEDLVYLLERSGIQTGYDLDRLNALAPWLADALGLAQLPAMVSRAGGFPPGSRAS